MVTYSDYFNEVTWHHDSRLFFFSPGVFGMVFLYMNDFLSTGYLKPAVPLIFSVKDHRESKA